MRSRFAFSAAFLLAALIPATSASAQDMGGFGGRGGGRNPGGLDMSLSPFYSDLAGPFAFDSVQVLLSLEVAQRTKLDQVRADHVAKTQALRDSVGRLAVAAGYTTPVPEPKPAGTVDKAKAIKEYTKLLERLRKIDSDYYLKTVKPVMNPSQWASYKEWVQVKGSQRGNRGGMGGMGMMRGGGGDF